MTEVALNQILITSKVPGAFFALRAPLYDIESTNTTKIMTQSVRAGEGREGNEHTVQKFSYESTISTKIPNGVLELIGDPTGTKQGVGMFVIAFKD